MTQPPVYQLALLAAAAYRATRLLSRDDITIPLRRWLTGMSDADAIAWAVIVEEYEALSRDPWKGEHHLPVGRSRMWLSRLLICPWCLGWWVSLAWFAAYEAAPFAVALAAVPFTMSAVTGLVASRE